MSDIHDNINRGLAGNSPIGFKISGQWGQCGSFFYFWKTTLINTVYTNITSSLAVPHAIHGSHPFKILKDVAFTV